MHWRCNNCDAFYALVLWLLRVASLVSVATRESRDEVVFSSIPKLLQIFDRSGRNLQSLTKLCCQKQEQSLCVLRGSENDCEIIGAVQMGQGSSRTPIFRSPVRS